MVGGVHRLTNPVRDYAWGVVDGLAGLVGREPTGRREAELWIGAHPGGPSRLDDGTTLDRAIAAAPEAMLGDDVLARFGPRLPYLLKVLAIGRALSIQLHPDAEQAAAGFAREEAEGPALDAPDRTYRDPHPKPEMLVALRRTTILVGLRPGDEAAGLLRAVDGAAARDLADAVEGEPDARAALVGLVTADDATRGELAAAAAATDGDGDGAPDDLLRWVARLAADSPGDPTALSPLVLGLRTLDAGDSVFLDAGIPHAYLEGAGVELMGASDNVVRGGLTPKHVDAEALVTLLAPPGTTPTALAGVDVAPGVRRYDPPAPELALHRLEPAGGSMPVPSTPPGPAVLLATGSSATVTSEHVSFVLDGGNAALVGPEERDEVTVSGDGTIWVATPGADDRAG